jgi:hypothetical protein
MGIQMKFQKRAHAHRFTLGLMLLAMAQVSCLGGGGGGNGSTPRDGEVCDRPDNDSGKACVGTVRFDCEEQDTVDADGNKTGTGEYRWAFDDDCADDGKTCSDGKCVEGPASSPCPQVSGGWRFDVHCDPAQVGRTFTVTQTGCDLVSVDGGFDGKVKANSDLEIEGTQAGSDFECEGTVGAASFLLNCTGNCEVSGSRN